MISGMEFNIQALRNSIHQGRKIRSAANLFQHPSPLKLIAQSDDIHWKPFIDESRQSCR